MIEEGQMTKYDDIHLMIEKEAIVLKGKEEIPGMKIMQLLVNMDTLLFPLFLVLLLQIHMKLVGRYWGF